MTTENRTPYGPAYQQKLANFALAAGCKGNEIGVLYRLMFKMDWNTGEVRGEYAHQNLAADMGLTYDTVQKIITKLRKAGVVKYADYRGKGVKWSNGEGYANRYCLKVPALDPPQKTGSPPREKRGDPTRKNTNHLFSSSLSGGRKEPPSRRQEAKSRPKTAEEQAQFSQLEREYSYGYALSWWKDLLKKETEQAE